jgi:uncharacterized protein YuzE
MDFLVLVDEAEFSRLSDRMIHAAGRYLAEVESHAHLLNLEFLADVPIHDSLEVDGVVIDYAKDKRIVAIELLDAGKRTTRKPLDLIGLAIVRSRCHAVYAEKRKKMPRPLLRHG